MKRVRKENLGKNVLRETGEQDDRFDEVMADMYHAACKAILAL